MKLLKYEAEWCGPCQTQSDILEDYDATPVETIDIDENPDAADEHDVRGIPFMVLLDDGEPVQSWQGVTQKEEIESAVENL